MILETTIERGKSPKKSYILRYKNKNIAEYS